ncbi:hypothetical protein ATO6_00625 [Oceanicola sp. 22II-s10i]|nr:hypothetical protein ATO6_00625 [Oceanicola sp. 22II-s10i]
MRWIVIAVVAVVVIMAGAVFFLPGDRIARIAADQIRAQTGRAVTFSGETKVTYWPVLGVTTGAVEVANADWSDKGPMFRAAGLKIGVETAALWGGAVRITELEAIRPEILLEKARDGRANWDFGSGGGTSAGTGGSDTAAQSGGMSARDVRLDKARIQNARLTIIDAGAGTRQSFQDVDIALDWPERSGPVAFDVTIRPAGEPVRVKGSLAAMDPLLDGKMTGVAFDLTAPGGTARFDGQVSTAGAAQGKVSADLGETAKFTNALGAGPVDLPRGLGRSAKVSGDLNYKGDSLAFSDGKATLDMNTLAFNANVTLAGKPYVKANVAAGALDLTALGGSGGGGGGSGGASDGWSRDPIDLSALSAINGEIGLTADSIDLGGLKPTSVSTLTTIDNARAATAIRSLSIFGGQIGGEVVLNNRSGFSTGGTVNVAGVDLQRLLTDMAGVDRLTGSADGQLKFLASGNSMAALMNSLSGSGNLKTGQGRILGIDLDQLFRTGQGAGGTTIFDSLTASWTIEGGNLVNRDLDMKLASIQARGEGRVGIGARDIDYLFTPISLKARDGRGVAIPIRIKGPWAAPRILPDLEKAIQLNLDEEKKALEAKARQEVEKKVTETLGVTKQEGESTEDAIRRKLEQEALKGLGKLLGGN